MIFFWRCLVDYISDRKRNDADKINAMSRFVSPLRTMVEHVEKYDFLTICFIRVTINFIFQNSRSSQESGCLSEH